MTKPETITEEDEEAEENEASAEAIANAANNMDVSNSGTEDAEVAAWVQSVLAKKASGEYGEDVPKPALHAAPLDAAANSPLVTPV
ncbi:hypothetical protein I5L01_15840 [Erythrobacter sp. YJ-T3-07]|nr:hypothetical protein [Erythrobacter sp. YJ-T3-07]